MVAVWLFRSEHYSLRLGPTLGKLLAALALAAIVMWCGYGFSVRPLHEATTIPPSSPPSFQHFPGPLRSAAKNLIRSDPRLPAPELLHGVAMAWVLNKTAAPAYLLGQTKTGGWWYFFLVALAVKLPLPLLLLLALSVVVLCKNKTERQMFFPLAALAAVLLITMHVSYQVGSRHVLVTVPLIAIVAGLGGGRLLKVASFRSLTTVALVALLIWQVVDSSRAQSDFLAYFNQLAGKDPSRVLVMGCDLDCGQDLFRLAEQLRARHVTIFTPAIWSSADIDRSGLPSAKLPGAPDYFQGWIALSSRALRLGDVLHQSVPAEDFAWLEQCQPVANVGRTIRLYYVTKEDDSKPKPQ